MLGRQFRLEAVEGEEGGDRVFLAKLEGEEAGLVPPLRLEV